MIEHQQVGDSGTDAADHVKRKESLGAPIIFENGSEHPQGKHIKENMLKSVVVVEEQVSYQLVRPEELGVDIMQGEHIKHPLRNI